MDRVEYAWAGQYRWHTATRFQRAAQRQNGSPGATGVKLLHKMLLALVAVSLVGLLAMMLIAHATFSYGFLRYLRERENNQLERLVPALSEHYRQQGDWEQLKHSPRLWHRIIRQVHQESSPLSSEEAAALRQHALSRSRQPPHKTQLQSHLARHFTARVFLLDSQRRPVIGRIPDTLEHSTLRPITVDGTPHGWVGLVFLQQVDTTRERNFQRHNAHALAVAALVCLLLAVPVSWWLARHLSNPVKQLARATGKVRRGDLSVRVNIADSSEIGALANDFNAMVQTLEHNEHARRRWISDIAHELRTPLGVLQGEVEALQDGLRPFNANSLQSLRSEIAQLSTLVGDLHHLALADSGALSYTMRPVALADLIDETLHAFAPRFAAKAIALLWQPGAAQRQWRIQGDARRLRQLLNNLLENSLRYTDTGGRCGLSLEASDTHIQLTISDSAPTVPAADLSRIFDRLYRVETSRSREHGGSGLGLAIVHSIVQAHAATITASQSPWGGLNLAVRFPRAPDQGVQHP